METPISGLLEKISGEVRDTFRRDRSILSFEEYMALVAENPRQQLKYPSG